MSVLGEVLPAAIAAAAPRARGRVSGVQGLAIEIEGLSSAVGEVLHLEQGDGMIAAEVVAVAPRTVAALPYGAPAGLRVGTPAYATGQGLTVAVGPDLRGRVLDGLGRPLDGRPLPGRLARVPVDGVAPNALTRRRVDRPLPVGVRAVDTLIPVGVGQRLGVFAGSGVGKSSLLSMITRGTAADVVVLALIGERGREVREFLEDDLGPDGLGNAVVVVATSDEPPMTRLRAAFTATAIAEYFRGRGSDVLLMMDSVTRLAMAQREIGLSVGEPPATRGYPPSVFAMMPRLLERAGTSEVGSITGIYTVLVEGDDHNEPIADTARSILDGHIVLDRRLAVSGHFPSIDAVASVSRVAGAVLGPSHAALAAETRALLAARAEVAELIEIGAYVPGSNPTADRAVGLWPALTAFLRQKKDEQVPAEQAWAALAALLGHEPAGQVPA